MVRVAVRISGAQVRRVGLFADQLPHPPPANPKRLNAMTMELKQRCQSCGMPLAAGEKSDKSFYGTNADGTVNDQYCKFCYAAGGFTEPQLTLSDMIKKSVSHMTRVLRVPEDKAKQMSNEIIPKLTRWQQP